MKKEFSKLAKAVTKNPVLPILEGVKVTKNKLITSNADIFISVSHNWEVNQECVIDFLELRTIAEKKVITKIIFNINMVEILTLDNRVFKLLAYPTIDYPTIEINSKSDVMLNLDYKFKIAQKYVSKEVLRPHLMHVCFKDAHIVATDAHIMYFERSKMDYDFFLLIPKELFWLSGNYSVTKEVKPKGSICIQLTGDNETVIYKMYDHKYVDFHSVIPINNEDILTVDKKEIASIVDDALMCANKTTNKIHFNGSISSQDIDLSKSFDSKYTSIQVGGAPNFSINGKSFLKIISDIDKKEISIEHNSFNSGRAMIINNSFLLMPMV